MTLLRTHLRSHLWVCEWGCAPEWTQSWRTLARSHPRCPCRNGRAESSLNTWGEKTTVWREWCSSPCVVLEWVMSMLKPLLLSIKFIKRREGEPSNNCHCYWLNLSMSIFKLYHKIKLIQGWNEVQSVINAVMLLLIKYDLIGALWTHTHTRKLIYLFSLVTWHWNNEKEALCSWISVHQLPSCCHFSLHQRVL